MSRLLLAGPALLGLLVASGAAMAADGIPACTGPGCVGGTHHGAGIAWVTNSRQQDDEPGRVRSWSFSPGGRERLLEVDVDEVAHRDQTLRCDGVGQLGQHPTARLMHRYPAVAGKVDEIGGPLAGCRRAEDLPHDRRGCRHRERLTNRLRTLGKKRSVMLAIRPLVQTQRSLDPRRANVGYLAAG